VLTVRVYGGYDLQAEFELDRSAIACSIAQDLFYEADSLGGVRLIEEQYSGRGESTSFKDFNILFHRFLDFSVKQRKNFEYNQKFLISHNFYFVFFDN
jgi:hypothetical protein